MTLVSYEDFFAQAIQGLIASNGIQSLGRSDLEDTILEIGVGHMALRVACGETVEQAMESQRRAEAGRSRWIAWVKGEKSKPPAPVVAAAPPAELTHAPTGESFEDRQERVQKAAAQEAALAVVGEAANEPDLS